MRAFIDDAAGNRIFDGTKRSVMIKEVLPVYDVIGRVIPYVVNPGRAPFLWFMVAGEGVATWSHNGSAFIVDTAGVTGYLMYGDR